MFAAVADTHTVIWYLFDDVRLSLRAGNVIDAARQRGERVAVSSISLVEVVYLVEKGRVARSTYDALREELGNAESVFVEVPFTREVAESMWRVPRAEVPDMPDRIVAATGIYLGVPVISRDGEIRASRVETIW